MGNLHKDFRQDRMPDFLREYEEQMFANQWRKIKNKNLRGIVPKDFVKELFHKVLYACNEKLIYFGIDPSGFEVNHEMLEHGKIIEQIYYYHLFHTSHLSNEERAAKQRCKEYKEELVALVSGNICLMSADIGLQAATTINSPEIIAYKLYANRILGTLSAFMYKKVPTVIDSLIIQAMGTIKGIVNLLADGLGGSAVSTWRHLYEQECTIIAILKSGKQNAYLEHQRFYDLEWDENGQLQDELEHKLAEYGLDKIEREKSRNRHDYIAYGWLLEIPEFKKGFEKRECRLNFKSGLQSYAGQIDRYDTYKEASKITHASGTMLSADADSYYRFVMLRLYETVNNFTPWIMKRIELEKMIKQPNENDMFVDAVNRDLEKMEKNNQIILDKYIQE